MQVLFNIPGPLRDFTQNRSDVRVDVQAGADLLKGQFELICSHLFGRKRSHNPPLIAGTIDTSTPGGIVVANPPV